MVSSAKRLTVELFLNIVREVINVDIRKRRGPRTLPWGTPEVTLMEEDILPSRRTCCVRLVRNECTQLSACSEMP